jgi:hypothetical protein
MRVKEEKNRALKAAAVGMAAVAASIGLIATVHATEKTNDPGRSVNVAWIDPDCLNYEPPSECDTQANAAP